MRTGIFGSRLAEAERKKHVNKQTKAETRVRWGGNERNREMERGENRTNIHEIEHKEREKARGEQVTK